MNDEQTVEMAVLGGQDVALGWDAEIWRTTESGGVVGVTDRAEVVQVVSRFLGFTTVPEADWATMVRDGVAGDDAPYWLIPLNLKWMARLAGGNGELDVEFTGYDGCRYEIEIREV